jgi:hypothetical protein
VCITGRHPALSVCAKGFAKRLVHDADFEKAFRKRTENALKFFAVDPDFSVPRPGVSASRAITR